MSETEGHKSNSCVSACVPSLNVLLPVRMSSLYTDKDRRSKQGKGNESDFQLKFV